MSNKEQNNFEDTNARGQLLLRRIRFISSSTLAAAACAQLYVGHYDLNSYHEYAAIGLSVSGLLPLLTRRLSSTNSQ